MQLPPNLCVAIYTFATKYKRGKEKNMLPQHLIITIEAIATKSNVAKQ
jgi:hypothetical protein